MWGGTGCLVLRMCYVPTIPKRYGLPLLSRLSSMVELEFPVAKCFNQNIVQQHPSLSAQWRTAPILTATSHRIKVETEITWAHIGGLRTTDIAEYGSPKAGRRLKKNNRQVVCRPGNCFGFIQTTYCTDICTDITEVARCPRRCEP